MKQITKNLTEEQIKALYDEGYQFIYLYRFADGKTYVGQSHKGAYRYGYPSVYREGNPEMYEAMRQGFFKEILCFTNNAMEADQLEDYYIQKYNSIENGYNRQSGGKSGYIVSDEIKKKISDSNRGKVISEETRKKISEANKGKKSYWYGKHHSEETRKKISESRKGENNPMYGKKGELSPSFGRIHTEESRKKMSEARIGKYTRENSPSAKKVKLIDLETLEEKIYDCIKDILDDYPEFNYNSLRSALMKQSKYQKRYKLEYADSDHINNTVNSDQVTININFYVQNRNSQNS